MKKGYITDVTSVKELQNIISLFEKAGVDSDNICINCRFDEIVTQAEPGDTLVVMSYADVFKSIHDFLSQYMSLTARGISVVSLTEANIKIEQEHIDFVRELHGLYGRLRAVTTRKGLNRARAEGKKLGRPVGTTKINAKFYKVDELRRSSKLSIAKACEMAGCNPRSYYRYMEKTE